MLYALIMAGGAGTRFWPASTRSRPKQFLSIDHGGKSLLRLTFERIKDTVPPQRVYVVTAAAQRDMTAKELPELGLENIFAEPVARNTAAAIGYGVIRITRGDPQAGFIVLPSDHLIENKDDFVASMTAGAQVAAKTDSIVTFGIVPTGASTAYGYIKKGAEHADVGGIKVFDVDQFKEKPDAATAKEYVGSGQYLWNSGMFIFKNTSFLAAMEKHLPKHYQAFLKIQASILSREEETVTVKEYYALESISIDHGILEKSENVKMAESKFDWKDVGSWSSLGEILDKDGDNNAARGDSVVLDSKDNVIVSEDGVIAAVGVEGLVIIHTPKATLVCRKEDTEKVRDIVEKLKKKGLEQYL
jgi:mannose-1-phosphate guanylyltransferase